MDIDNQSKFEKPIPKTPLEQKIEDRQKIFEKFQETEADIARIKKELKEKKRFDDIKQDKKKPSFAQNVWNNLLGIFTFGKKGTTPSKEDIFKDAKDREIEGLNVKDIIAPIDMEIDFKHVQIGGRYFRTLYIVGYPRNVSPNWLSPIINFEHSLRISTFYYPVESSFVLEKLKRKIGEFEATLYGQIEKHKPPDPTIKIALTDAQQLQEAIAAGTERFFRFGLYITLFADTYEELEKISNNAIATLAAINVKAVPAVLLQEQGLITTQPVGVDQLDMTRNMTTSVIASTFPFVTSELTMDKGILYGINLHNNSLVIFDRFALENANFVVFAKSGAGKSYFVKLEAVRSLMFGTEVIIIDPEKEFDRLCEAVNGSYISFSQDGAFKMNPFELSGLGDPNDDELRMKILSLQGFLRVLFGGVTNVEQSILDRALLLTYREKGITLDPSTQRGREYPLLEDLYKVLKGMSEPEARNLARRLEMYIMGSGAGIFNEKSSVELNNPFTVFSVRDLQEELRPMAMYLILDFIWTRIRKDQKKRLLIVDEAWYMMQNEDSANFMYSIAKRARKYYLGLTTVTQNVDDFLASSKGAAIISNSSLQFLMKQSPNEIKKLKRTFNLSEGEVNYLLNADRGQGLFFAGANHVAMQVISSRMEHDLITTDPKDLEKMRQGKKSQLSDVELAEMFAPPAVQNPIKQGVKTKASELLHSAINQRKEEIREIMKEKLAYAEDSEDTKNVK